MKRRPSDRTEQQLEVQGSERDLAPESCLFVAADEPLLVYASREEAERHLEAIDVAEGVYPAAYGPLGEPYRISEDGHRVVIELTGEASQPERLRELLLRYFEASGTPASPDESLEILVQRAWAERAARSSPQGCWAAIGIGAAVAFVLLNSRFAFLS